MKVNVLQAAEISFARWQIWSCWIDISIFQCGSHTYLIQMKISRNNKKKFRTVGIASRPSSLHDISELTQMKREAA